MVEKKRSEIDFSGYSDERLLGMIEEIRNAKDENGKSLGQKSFQEFFGVDFTCEQAIYEMEMRGYVQIVEKRWAKAGDTSVCDNSVKNVVIDLTECRRGECTRLQKTVSCELADKIERLLEDIPKNDKKSLAFEAMLMPAVDALLEAKDQHRLVIKDKRRVVREEEYEL